MPGLMPPGLMPPQQRAVPPGLDGAFDPRDLQAQLQAKAAGQQKLGLASVAGGPDGGPAGVADFGGFSPGPIPLRQMTDDERATPIDFRGGPQMGGGGGLIQPQPGPMPMQRQPLAGPRPGLEGGMGGALARLPQLGQAPQFKMGPMASLGRSVMAQRQMTRGGFGKPRKRAALGY